MRFSTNLNIILKAIANATNHVSRDFIELENLQSNPVSAQKFALACCQKIKKILLQEFTKFRPEYDLIFSDFEEIKRGNANNKYRIAVNFLDGFDNLIRSNGDFTIAVSLTHQNSVGNFEPIANAIFKVIGNEMFYCEKGFGSYLNNRRLRVSKRNYGQILVGCNNFNFLPKNNEKQNFLARNYGCRTMEIGYLAASRLEKVILEKSENEEEKNYFENFVRPFFLLVVEAGGAIAENENSIIISN